MHYRDSGGSASAVIFVHGGFPSLATVWDTASDALEEWEQRIAADHRFVSFRVGATTRRRAPTMATTSTVRHAT
jgi:hypothetical protein